MATKQERLAEIMRRLRDVSPFCDGIEARVALKGIMKCVEDELSGIPENPDAAISVTDGRMYPPDDKFEISSGCIRVRVFKMVRHRTWIGDNGALLITRSDQTVALDLPGRDGDRVSDLLSEANHAVN